MKLKRVAGIAVLVVLVLMMFFPAFAQCPMCRASAETSLQEGSTHALGLNRGILYLLTFPYLLCGVIFLLWYRQQKRNRLTAS